jgi:hypothetical protein
MDMKKYILIVSSVMLLCLNSVYSAPIPSVSPTTFDSYLHYNNGFVYYDFAEEGVVPITIQNLVIDRANGGDPFLVNIQLVNADTSEYVTSNENITYSIYPSDTNDYFSQIVNNNKVVGNLPTGNYYIEVNLYDVDLPESQNAQYISNIFAYTETIETPVTTLTTGQRVTDMGNALGGFLNAIRDPIVTLIVMLGLIFILVVFGDAIAQSIKRGLKK